MFGCSVKPVVVFCFRSGKLGHMLVFGDWKSSLSRNGQAWENSPKTRIVDMRYKSILEEHCTSNQQMQRGSNGNERYARVAPSVR